MENKLTYVWDTIDCMKLIKKRYPFIPKWIIQRVLFAEGLYMYKVGIIEYVPKLEYWYWK